jgi:phosphate transport system substrate-binding protein
VKPPDGSVEGMRTETRLKWWAGVVGATAVVLSACGGSTPSQSGTGSQLSSQVIQVDGSSTVFPVTEAVAEEFQRAHQGTRVTVGSSGTGGGFQKFCRDEIDISDASRPIRASEAEACAKANVNYIELPVGYDGIAVVVHPKNTWAASMTVAELKKLWEPSAQGKVTRWNQIRSSWPDQEIHLFGAGVDSGTFDYFTEVIAGKTQASRGDYTSSEDDNVIVQGVSGDEYALGYFGFAYYEQNKDKLKIVAIDDGNEANGQGAIAPSPESVKDGTYAPLSRPIFIYPKVKALDRAEVASFVDFYLTKGTALVREVGYIPLTDREYDLVRARLKSRKTGTMYTEADAHAQIPLEQRLSK